MVSTDALIEKAASKVTYALKAYVIDRFTQFMSTTNANLHNNVFLKLHSSAELSAFKVILS